MGLRRTSGVRAARDAAEVWQPHEVAEDVARQRARDVACGDTVHFCEAQRAAVAGRPLCYAKDEKKRAATTVW